jgi:hypothetical protein
MAKNKRIKRMYQFPTVSFSEHTKIHYNFDREKGLISLRPCSPGPRDAYSPRNGRVN